VTSSLLNQRCPPAVGSGSPDPAAGGPLPGAPARPPVIERVRLAAVCLGFLGLSLAQQPGRIVGDTKLDLAVDPLGFLARALQLWEPEGFAGQVQNQAYGYLFPMGPFFALGQLAGIPPWVVQRLWLALLLSLAFLGAVTLARRLGIGTPGSRLIGGLAYALAPRMISGLGATSIEVLPMALAPWVLVPLIAGAAGGSARRAALLSGLAVFCVGGVNAVATSAVLPLAVLWLLTRPAGPRRRRLMVWWVGAVALATAWWVGPLLLLGRYASPFLDYIESASTTTSTTDVLATLRGTTQWLSYLAGVQGPVWPAGWELVRDTGPILATVVMAAVGLWGLARRDLADRGWLVLGVLAGLVLVGLGHLGSVQGLVAEQVHDLLDGVLAPLRNVHKFDPVLRLPLALGVAHLCGVALRRAHRRQPLPGSAAGAAGSARSLRGLLALVGPHRPARAAVGVVVLALLVTASPAIAGRLAAPDGFEALPQHWEETADWLAENAGTGRALLLPGSSFGTYAWGQTGDEPLQALADSPWEVRNAIPLTPAGHIRMLDAVEERLNRGEGSAGLTRFLARSGITHLVVRNDLDAGTADATRPILVHQALRDSPGITRVATFGPTFPSATSFLGRTLDALLTPLRPAVEVFTVDDPGSRAYTVPLDEAVTVAGGPDGILELEDRDLLGDRPVLLADGDAPDTASTMVSDAQLRRERAFGSINGAESGGLDADDPLRLDAPARDYLYPGAEFGESVVRLEGGDISASSSAADVTSLGGARTDAHPAAAVDGDLRTAWRPARRFGTEPVWWRLAGDRPITADEIMVQLADDPDTLPPTGVRIRTDSGSHVVALADTAEPQWLPLPDGPTRTVEIIAAGGPGGGPADSLALAEVVVPGTEVTRTVVTPGPGGAVDAYAFDTSNPPASGCAVSVDRRPRCAAALVGAAEEGAGLDRVFSIHRPARYGMTVQAVPSPGPALDALIAGTARPWGPSVTASSSVTPDPRANADAAMDGDPLTTWTAAAGDGHPSLTLAWGAPLTIDRLRLVLTPDTAASTPLVVSLSNGTWERTVGLEEDGTAVFPAFTTDRLEISFPLLDEQTSYDPYTGAVSTLGVGISELEIPGLPAGDPRATAVLRYGEGPTVAVDGQVRATALRTTLAGLRALQPVELEFCSGSATTGWLGQGEHRFVARSTGAFAVDTATLLRDGIRPGGALVDRAAVDVGRWDAEHRTVRVAARSRPTLLVVAENENAGWVAALDGTPLEKQTVDGWQQGYLLPPGAAGEVTLDFQPGGAYRAALAGGAAAVLLLVGLLLVPARRPGPPATGRRERGGVLVGLAGVAGLALVGGVAGLVIGAVAALLLMGTRRPTLGRWLPGAAMLAAGVASVVPGGDDGATVGQLLALVAVAALVVSLLPRGPGRRLTRSRHRLSGRSIVP
jgi:arabinofuranan 3-O-arabinosyltransferase